MAGERPDPENDAQRRVLEAFSRDLLALSRSVRVYPPDHPFLTSLAERLTTALAAPLPVPLSLGVTSRELAVGGRFFGDRDSRTAELAAHLHGRKVLRVTWTGETSPPDIVALAELLANPRLSGDDLDKALRRRRVFSIEVEPLVLERIHESFQQAPGHGPREGGGREAWQWLLDGDASPEELASLLASDQFWETDWGDAGNGGGTGEGEPRPAEILLRMGERLDSALEHLAAGQRRRVLDRLADVGRQISPRELAAILDAADLSGVLDGPLGDVVEQTFGGEKIVDLLAGLVDREGRNTRRLAEVYSALAHGESDELLEAVRARLTSPEKGGFTVEVWEAVEEFLLGLRESPYMGSEYSSSLEALASATHGVSDHADPMNLSGDVEGHLDRVLLGLAVDAGPWRPRLLDRLEARAEALSLTALLRVLEEVRDEVPGLLDSRPSLPERVFRKGLQTLRELDPDDRQALLAFGRAHERAVLDATLRALGEEEGISTRRFLVELVAGFSPAATPSLVSRLRSAPWYVARNLTIALGLRKDDAAVPALRSLFGHEHPKVRREAILALGHFDAAAARDALHEITASRGYSREDQALAQRALRGTAAPEAGT
ncbi:MAG: HEAT repeat domain-containing protein [Deltaproteobacteria bacterium]|nr:HEAT repeat domain-containing protein [Deltaproteobacteria bacterium]